MGAVEGCLRSLLVTRVLYDLEKAALTLDVPLEVVVGSAPGWEERWSRNVHVQRARLSATVH
jgi:hypothetical protein